MVTEKNIHFVVRITSKYRNIEDKYLEITLYHNYFVLYLKFGNIRVSCAQHSIPN